MIPCLGRVSLPRIFLYHTFQNMHKSCNLIEGIHSGKADAKRIAARTECRVGCWRTVHSCAGTNTESAKTFRNERGRDIMKSKKQKRPVFRFGHIEICTLHIVQNSFGVAIQHMLAFLDSRSPKRSHKAQACTKSNDAGRCHRSRFKGIWRFMPHVTLRGISAVSAVDTAEKAFKIKIIGKSGKSASLRSVKSFMPRRTKRGNAISFHRNIINARALCRVHNVKKISCPTKRPDLADRQTPRTNIGSMSGDDRSRARTNLSVNFTKKCIIRL